MSSRQKSLLLLFAFGAVFLMVQAIRKDQRDVARQTAAPAVVAPIELGEHVYRFPAVNDAFEQMLVRFYAQHKDYRCDFQAPVLQQRDLGTDRPIQLVTGFVLHCHPIPIEAQSETIP